MAFPGIQQIDKNLRNPADRRSSDRFPIERDVRFKILSKRAEETGRGITMNMSSSGVLLSTDRALIPGKRIEMAISWPAQLNDSCPLKLVARGRVIRTSGGQAAVEIQKYEFRTLGANGLNL